MKTTEPGHCSPEWHTRRKELEQQDEMPTAEQLDHFNIWTPLWDFTDAIWMCLRKNSPWQWWLNSRCKYINIRVDMRTGHCRVTDQNGKRITIDDLKYQPTFEGDDT